VGYGGQDGAEVVGMRYIVVVSKSGVAFHFPPQSKTSPCGTYLTQKGGWDFHSVAFIRLFMADFFCVSGSKNYKQRPLTHF
jgi:hypothetical protein